MNFLEILLSIALLSCGRLLVSASSEDPRISNCTTAVINYSNEWREWTSQCMKKFMQEKEIEIMNNVGLVASVAKTPLTVLYALKCSYVQMNIWFLMQPSIGVDGSLFYDYLVPEKINHVPTGKTAFEITRFKTNIDDGKTISPFHPQGGWITKQANVIWKNCSSDADLHYLKLYDKQPTVTAANAMEIPSVKIQLFPYAKFATCIQEHMKKLYENNLCFK